MKRVFLVQYYDGNDYLFKLVEVKRDSYIECLIAMRDYQDTRNNDDSSIYPYFDIQSIMELSPTFDEDTMGSYFIYQGRVVDLHIPESEREVLQ